MQTPNKGRFQSPKFDHSTSKQNYDKNDSVMKMNR